MPLERVLLKVEKRSAGALSRSDLQELTAVNGGVSKLVGSMRYAESALKHMNQVSEFGVLAPYQMHLALDLQAISELSHRLYLRVLSAAVREHDTLCARVERLTMGSIDTSLVPDTRKALGYAAAALEYSAPLDSNGMRMFDISRLPTTCLQLILQHLLEYGPDCIEHFRMTCVRFANVLRRGTLQDYKTRMNLRLWRDPLAWLRQHKFIRDASRMDSTPLFSIREMHIFIPPVASSKKDIKYPVRIPEKTMETLCYILNRLSHYTPMLDTLFVRLPYDEYYDMVTGQTLNLSPCVTRLVVPDAFSTIYAPGVKLLELTDRKEQRSTVYYTESGWKSCMPAVEHLVLEADCANIDMILSLFFAQCPLKTLILHDLRDSVAILRSFLRTETSTTTNVFLNGADPTYHVSLACEAALLCENWKGRIYVNSLAINYLFGIVDSGTFLKNAIIEERLRFHICRSDDFPKLTAAEALKRSGLEQLCTHPRYRNKEWAAAALKSFSMISYTHDSVVITPMPLQRPTCLP